METRKTKILIVDDSELNRAIRAGMLEDQYALMEAQNGLEAVLSPATVRPPHRPRPAGRGHAGHGWLQCTGRDE